MQSRCFILLRIQFSLCFAKMEFLGISLNSTFKVFRNEDANHFRMPTNNSIVSVPLWIVVMNSKFGQIQVVKIKYYGSLTNQFIIYTFIIRSPWSSLFFIFFIIAKLELIMVWNDKFFKIVEYKFLWYFFQISD